MKFQEIRSATAIVTFGEVRFLIDPWLGDRGSIPPIPGSPNPELRCPVSDLPLPLAEILNVDAVIATHLHFDHFDERAMEVIPRDMPIFVQDGRDGETLRAKGFTDIRILKYAGVEFKGVQLIKTDCLHGQPGNIGLLYETVNMRKSACGVVMRHPAEAKTLYLAGDTIWCDYVKAAIDTFAPDVIVVNAAEATIVGFGRIIMGLEDVQAVLDHAPARLSSPATWTTSATRNSGAAICAAISGNITWRRGFWCRRTAKSAGFERRKSLCRIMNIITIITNSPPMRSRGVHFCSGLC